jgi:uncharacterized membrane protein
LRHSRLPPLAKFAHKIKTVGLKKFFSNVCFLHIYKHHHAHARSQLSSTDSIDGSALADEKLLLLDAVMCCCHWLCLARASRSDDPERLRRLFRLQNRRIPDLPPGRMTAASSATWG